MPTPSQVLRFCAKMARHKAGTGGLVLPSGGAIPAPIPCVATNSSTVFPHPNPTEE